MMPGTEVSLALIIISLGVIGVILSFSLTDKRKSQISLILAGIIVLVGVVRFGQHSLSRHRWNRRMKTYSQERPADMEALKKRLQERAQENKKAAEPPKTK